MQPLLRSLLDASHVDVGENDAWYDFMEEASQKLAQHFAKHPDAAIPALLVSLDDEATEDEPSFQHAEDVLRQKWNSFRSRFKERPRPLLRILLYAALKRAADQSDVLPSILWLTAESIYPYLQFGREKEIVDRVLSSYAEAAECAARGQDSAPVELQTTASTPMTSIVIPKIDARVIDANEYLTHIASTVGPQDAYGRSAIFASAHYSPNGQTTASNRVWANNPDAWAYGFAPRMNEILVSAINTGSQRLANAILDALGGLKSSLQESLDSQVGMLTDLAGLLFRQSQQQNQSAGLKNDVLWWLQSMYSQSLRTSYRSLPSIEATLIMAQDLGVALILRSPVR